MSRYDRPLLISPMLIFALKMRRACYLIVYTPFAKLYCIQIFSRERAVFSLEPLL
jgi:hypothetical protein